MQLVSVIIPTHNRHDLLAEAVASVECQTYADIEIVVLDDGSTAPVEAKQLQQLTSRPVQVIRNDVPVSSIWCRKQGVDTARGDIVVHLDDDDLLSPNAIETVANELAGEDQNKLVFMATEGFGPRADYFHTAQQSAIDRIKQNPACFAVECSKTYFNQAVFDGMLTTVPSAFQRIAATKEVWLKVTTYRNEIYCDNHHIGDESELQQLIRPPLRDSEWSLYGVSLYPAVMVGRGLYRFRCEGQSEISRPENLRRAMEARVNILENLYQSCVRVPFFNDRKEKIKSVLSDAYFDMSYHDFQRGCRSSAYKVLSKSLRVCVTLKSLKFAMRMLLPVAHGS